MSHRNILCNLFCDFRKNFSLCRFFVHVLPIASEGWAFMPQLLFVPLRRIHSQTLHILPPVHRVINYGVESEFKSMIGLMFLMLLLWWASGCAEHVCGVFAKVMYNACVHMCRQELCHIILHLNLKPIHLISPNFCYIFRKQMPLKLLTWRMTLFLKFVLWLPHHRLIYSEAIVFYFSYKVRPYVCWVMER